MGQRCAKLGLHTNNGFSGVYDFSGREPYSELFAKFCVGQKPNGLIMRHPGFVDGALRHADLVTDQRTVEHDFFVSDQMLETLQGANLVVSRFQVEG